MSERPLKRHVQRSRQEVDREEVRIKLRSIARSELTCCWLLQLELRAAIDVSETTPEIRRRAEVVAEALAVAERAYDDLQAELGYPAVQAHG